MIAEHKNTQHNAMLMGNIRTLVGSPGGDIEWLIADTQMNGKCSMWRCRKYDDVHNHHHFAGENEFGWILELKRWDD